MSNYIMVSSPTVQPDLVTKTDYVVYIPLATKDTYGSVKVGDGLKIDYGVISLDSDLLEDKLDVNLGIENANKFLYVNENGFVDLKYAEQIQYASKNDFPEVGNDKLIYVDLSKGSLWIHSNNEYKEISSVLSIDSDDWISIEGPTKHNVSGLDFGLDFSVSFPNENGISRITLSDYFKKEYNSSYKNVEYDAVTGVLTFTKINNEKTQIDLPLELLVKSGYYDEFTESLILVLANDDVITIPVTDLVKDSYTKNDIDELLSNKQNLLTAGDNINIDENNVISADFTVNQLDNIIDDTETIIKTTDGTKLSLHLSASIVNKLSKVLVLPASTPSSTELVAVDSNGNQTMVGIGDNLSLENGKLNATGGGEGGGLNIEDLPKFTNKLYINMANATSLAGVLTLLIVSSSNFIVDWGDGTTTDYVEATTEISHTYSDINFQGWIYIYGDWKGIVQNNNSNRLTIEKVMYDINIDVIERYTFYDCSKLSDIIFANQSIIINERAFQNSAISFIDLPKNLTTIDKYCFGDCSQLKDIKIPSTVSVIRERAFQNCYNFNKIIIPDNVQIIDAFAFSDPRSLKYVQIGETSQSAISSLGSKSLYSPNSAFDKVVIKASKVPTVLTTTFASNVKIFIVPYSQLRAFKTATNWTEDADKIYPEGGNYSETITIPASSWDTSTNTVTVEAVGSTSEDRNIITWNVSSGGVQTENTYGLKCTAQGTMSLTFSCETIPTEDVEVSVRYMLTNY